MHWHNRYLGQNLHMTSWQTPTDLIIISKAILTKSRLTHTNIKRSKTNISESAMGLQSIRRRVQYLNGNLVIHSDTSATEISIKIPRPLPTPTWFKNASHLLLPSPRARKPPAPGGAQKIDQIIVRTKQLIVVII